jgi:DNA-binding HxlR family transcriptional regulator
MVERKTTSSNYRNQSFLESKRALNELLHLLSKRWITEIFLRITEGSNRFSSIKDELGFISDHILADRLRLLESNLLISRKVFNEIPSRVEYSLTDKGMVLSSVLGQLGSFAETSGSHPIVYAVPFEFMPSTVLDNLH